MSKIHPSAIVDPKAELDSSVEVGPYAIIGPNVKIGADTVIQSHAYISGFTRIGSKCEIYPFACVGMKTQDLKYKEGDVTYVEIGDRTVVREYVSIHLGTKPGEVTLVGSDCLIMAYCHVAHGCKVADNVIMSNATTLAGEVVVEEYAIIGGLTGVHQFCRVGAHSMVAGASQIRQDCPPYMLTESAGGTTQVRGPNIVGLQRRGYGSGVRTALKEAFKLLYREGLNRSQALERIKYEVDDIPEIRQLVQFYADSKRGVH